MASTSSSISMGKLYIASMDMRGKWAEKPHDNVLVVNVTSAQSKTSKNRLTFSPMTPVEGGYKGTYLCFENWWQHLKWYEGDTDESFEKRNEWWKSQTSPKRRYPGSKGKKVLYAWDGQHKYDYVSSRRKLYAPNYIELIKNRPLVSELRDKLKKGIDIVLYDFDGPRDPQTGVPLCKEVTPSLIKEKFNDTNFPWGHGYVISILLLGLTIDDVLSE